MRVAVLGQGSIGRRHARIALELGHELAVYDPDPRAQAIRGAEIAVGEEDCLRWADAVVVASPSSEHARQARSAIEHGVPVLVEKPLALDAACAAELDWLARERGVALSVAMNLREHPGVAALKRAVVDGEVGEILSARAWCGSWLPGWRAHTDYRDSYSARAALGGGVLLDVAVHEIDYLLWLAGPVRSVSAIAGHASGLELDVEDVALIALELEGGGVAQVSADYFDRSYTRGCRIVGSRGTLHWSWVQELLIRCDASGRTDRSHPPSDVAPTYQAQMERFLRAVCSEAAGPVPASCAQRVLAVIDAARVSAREGRRVAPAPALTLRAAGERDGALLLAWRNDPQTRRWSRNSAEIEPAEHADWLRLTLADGSTQLWIVERDGQPVGQVRVDGEREGMAEIHIAVAAQVRGQGVGAAALAQTAVRAQRDPRVMGLYARVEPRNEASLRAFARAGFRAAGNEADGFARLELAVRPATTGATKAEAGR